MTGTAIYPGSRAPAFSFLPHIKGVTGARDTLEGLPEANIAQLLEGIAKFLPALIYSYAIQAFSILQFDCMP